MAGTLTPTPFQTVLDADGVAVSGALIYTYVGGTTTNATTYADASLATPNANPIVADAAGRFVAYLPAGGNFKFLYKTAAGATIEEQDNILSVPGAAVNLDIEGTVGQAVTAGQVCYLSTGAEATPLTAGLWYLTDADFAPTSTTCQSVGVAVSAIAINTAGTIRLAGTATMATAVVIGSTYYVSATAGAITATPPALSRTVGVALTTSTLLLAATTAVVTPAGSNTQVQFNDSGVLGGDAGFTFIKATDAVAIAGPTTVGGTLGVTGATTLSSTASVAGAMLVTGFARLKAGLSTDDTDPGATNLRVGGTSALVGNVNMSGLLTVSGFGTHSFSAGGTGSQNLYVENTTSGAANRAMLRAVAGTNDASLLAFSQGYTTSGYAVASGSALIASGVGGLSILAENASGAIRFYSGGTTQRAAFLTTGQLVHGSTTAIGSGWYTAAYNGGSYSGIVIDETANTSGTTFMNFRSNGVSAGNISRTGTTAVVVYTTTSDERMKRDLGVVASTDVLSRTVIHDYIWRNDGQPGRGVFAQEAFTVIPVAISAGNDSVMPDGRLAEPWAVDYSKYVPDLIVGWQQHDATISQLAARIAALETKDH